MGNSLSDQLLKAGLTTKKKANKVQQQKHKQEKMRRHNKVAVVNEAKALADEAMKEATQRDRELNQQHQQAAEQKAIAAQIKQLINLNQLDRDEAEIEYNFTDSNNVKKILVTAAMQEQLSKGQLAIVKISNGYEVVPAIVADKIKQRDSNCIIQRYESSEVETEDEYADYKIPDDLMW